MWQKQLRNIIYNIAYNSNSKRLLQDCKLECNSFVSKDGLCERHQRLSWQVNRNENLTRTRKLINQNHFNFEVWWSAVAIGLDIAPTITCIWVTEPPIELKVHTVASSGVSLCLRQSWEMVPAKRLMKRRKSQKITSYAFGRIQEELIRCKTKQKIEKENVWFDWQRLILSM